MPRPLFNGERLVSSIGSVRITGYPHAKEWSWTLILYRVCIVKAMVFPVAVYGCELDHKEGWVLKNWCFWTVVLENTFENPLDCKEIKPVSPKGNQPWILIGRPDAAALILWPPHAKGWLIGEDPDAGRGWRHEEKGTTEDEKIGWHHRLNGHEFEQTPGVVDREAWCAACNPLCCKVGHNLGTEQQQQLLKVRQKRRKKNTRLSLLD